nr:hypothetical protein [Candidatus Sigynarchaeota archaeon]
MDVGFTNTTTSSILFQNTNTNDSRVKFLDLLPYQRAGFSIYKVDVNVTSNSVVAQDDWYILEGNPTLTTIRITNDSLPINNNALLANSISETKRYQIRTVEIRYFASTASTGVPNPALELWDSSAGSPNTMKWTTTLPTTASTGWQSRNPNYNVDVSGSTNQTWFVVVNGTDWGTDPDNTESSDRVYWYYASSATIKYGWTKSYVTDWDDQYIRFGLRYKRLYLEDLTNSNRSFTPASIYLKANNVDFDADGKASISGTNITSLRFTTNTTCVSFSASLKLYYKKIVESTHAFTTSGGANVAWNITSQAILSFPAGTKNNVEINLTKPSGWTVLGVYGASTVGELGTSANYTSYTVAGDLVRITGISSDWYWQVRCSSVNQVTGITARVGGTSTASANVSDTVAFEVDSVSAL